MHGQAVLFWFSCLGGEWWLSICLFRLDQICVCAHTCTHACIHVINHSLARHQCHSCKHLANIHKAQLCKDIDATHVNIVHTFMQHSLAHM